MRCWSCERRLVAYVERTLEPAARAGVVAHLASCARCRALAARVQIVETTLTTAPALEPAPNFAFRIMAEVRTLPAPRRSVLPLLRLGTTYLIFAWTVIALLVMLDGGTHARAVADFLVRGERHLALAAVALAHDGGRLVGSATGRVAATVGVVLFCDGVALAATALAVCFVRPVWARAGSGR